MPIFSRSKATDKKPSPPPTPSEDAPSPSSSPKPRASYVPRHAARDCLAAAPPGWNISSREHAMMENRKRIAMSRSQSANSLPRMRPMTRSGSDTSMGSSSLSSIASSSRVISLSDSRMAEHASRPQMHKNYFSHSGVVGRSPPVSNLAAWSPSTSLCIVPPLPAPLRPAYLTLSALSYALIHLSRPQARPLNSVKRKKRWRRNTRATSATPHVCTSIHIY